MDVGPREDQEDCILVKGTVVQGKKYEDNRDFSSNDIELMAVSDGMGGLAAGEKASRLVCEGLAQFSGDSGQTENIRDNLEKIQEKMALDLNEECGATVAGMVISPSGIQVFNLGDSRVYRVLPGKLDCISYDHSMVQVLLDDGKITDQEAFEHPYRNLITAGMGPAFSYKWALETIYLHEEAVEKERSGYLICSDGVCDVLTDREIADVLGDSPVKNGPALMEAIRNVFMKDNTSFIVVEINP